MLRTRYDRKRCRRTHTPIQRRYRDHNTRSWWRSTISSIIRNISMKVSRHNQYCEFRQVRLLHHWRRGSKIKKRKDISHIYMDEISYLKCKDNKHKTYAWKCHPKYFWGNSSSKNKHLIKKIVVTKSPTKITIIEF